MQYKTLKGLELISGKWLDGNPYSGFITYKEIYKAIIFILFFLISILFYFLI